MGIKSPSLAKEIVVILILKLALIFIIWMLFFRPVQVDQSNSAINNQFLNASPSASKESDNDR
ncbi:cytochrome oxidase putative small subunit CydP [Gallaecimonas mangrovi]|uniref:cytochrome oxidase putative small subunit CydP n=1 Tax=Gallaecimonas mangrovi TaxID=2291597 RepID=UPI000E1FC427|nr:cytochrome oxidase putative small subunit CydP [Gallaecimonas mangrovi]